MPTPKSPLDRPSSSHHRRPGGSRRSSSEKSVTKHGMKSGQAVQGNTKDSMSDPVSSAAKAPTPTPTTAQTSSDKKDKRSYDANTVRWAESRAVVAPESSGADVPQAETIRDERGGNHKGSVGSGGSAIPKNTSIEELERVRATVNAHIQLNQQRDKLSRHLSERGEQRNDAPRATGGKARVSPINEETAFGSPSIEEAFASPPPLGPETTSTSSAATIRGASTPAAGTTARTPSYPFPSMRTPRQFSYTGHRPFTALSPTVNPANYAGGSFDRVQRDSVMSAPITPASTLNFQPPGTSQLRDPNFETPNLYDISLRLMSEPGLDSWWTTVAKIMSDSYKADRVTLTIPADPTDVENVPWAQKATFNINEEDDLSLGYMAHGSSFLPSSVDTNETSNSEDAGDSPPLHLPSIDSLRPGLSSRHSFTAYEDTKREPMPFSEASKGSAARPTISRAKSYATTRHDVPPRTATLQNAKLSLQSLEHHLEFEDTKSAEWEDFEVAPREVRGRVFPVLQALDYEADPLIDNAGVMKVLDRGKGIVLTRDYPYIEKQESVEEKSGGSGSARQHSQRGRKSRTSPNERPKRGKTPDLGTRLQSFLGSKGKHPHTRSLSRSQTSDKGRSIPTSASSHTHDQDDDAVPTAKYEEYEQGPPSPWSQSPAPSPAVRVETDENPFFANTSIYEDTFDPKMTTSREYSQSSQLEAIGIDRSWTVLHIPLMHPLLSKPVHAFRLDAAAMEQKSAGRGKPTDKKEKDKPKETESVSEKQTPVAILSLLSPVIPYPSNLKHSLDFLAPHLATSYSLCRHHSNLQTEIAGLSRKGPRQAGFGAVVSGRRHLDDRVNFAQPVSSPIDDVGLQVSSGTGGSITSPSDYSGMSRSAAGSPAATPGWEQTTVGIHRDKRHGGSPGNATGESYFSSRSRPALGRIDTGSASSVTGARPSKESSPADKRSHQHNRSIEGIPETHASDSKDNNEQGGKSDQDEVRSSTTTPRQEIRKHPERSTREIHSEASEAREASPSRHQAEPPASPRRQAVRMASSQSIRVDRPHTQLHSYGADFSATFQSLPPTTSVQPAKLQPPPKVQPRPGLVSTPTDMPPPSDRVKGLMLDSLPAHVFVAMPPTGEIVWVNNRYLTYRGQTVQDLYQDPWASLHPDERDEYLQAWTHAVRSGEQFSKQVRIKRFDGNYRWFYTRAVGHRDHRGVIVQWYGTHMDIHDQHLAEVKAARQEEIEASEAKHRQLANLIPQITFAATEDEGITFANEQWLSYTGQSFDDALGLGFMDYIHPEDLVKCNIPREQPPTPRQAPKKKPAEISRVSSHSSSTGQSSGKSSLVSDAPSEPTVKGIHQSLSRNNSSSSGSLYEFPIADLAELARTGVIKVTTDSDGRQSYETEVRLRSKTGDYRWHLVRCVEVENIALGSGDGSWFGACTDIHGHKLLEKTLKETMDIKARFLSNMSHEIRTPLIGISGMVNFLQDTTLNDEQSDYCQTIKSSADSLLNIINDILDLSKVDAGMMKLSYQWFHTRSLVEEVNELLYSLAITKRIEINYMVDADVPEMVKGDKFRIRQVLLNVVGNAIKFTTAGEVFSRCRIFKDASVGENEVMLEYSIIDTGSGFTEEEAEMIFKPFSQIDGSSTRTHGGTGLGLVISRQLVELHGGKMEGTSVPEEGSTFTFTAKFSLPTEEDHPEPPSTPMMSRDISSRASVQSLASKDPATAAQVLKQASSIGVIPDAQLTQSPATLSPKTESSINSPAVSSSSSVPSVRSNRSYATHRSSSSSVAQSLAHFSQATRPGSTELAQMKLALPEKQSSTSSAPAWAQIGAEPGGMTPTPTSGASRRNSPSLSGLKHFRPPMYSILIICPQKHSREATTQHIEMTLPKDIPHQITALGSVAEAQEMIGGDDPVIFTHIVLNLGFNEEIVTLIDNIFASVSLPQTSVIVLSNPVQRQEIIRMATDYDYDQLAKDNRLTFVFKPVKPSRFAVIFDPDHERNLSTDRNRSTAQQQVADQKQSYLDVTQRLGNKGLMVLLVEDNLVNQKVLLKFLSKIGIAVEVALDGVECVNMVFSRPHEFYSLILCDLHMPNKDGYETCREIRAWEKENGHPRMPIIALSANVMADVMERCVQAGFNNYVTKPVDFQALSGTMGDLLDPLSG
ncbi:Peroxide stress-activated histidine kinase [Lachnellula hyalina]|uniref:histidine kinase n=1 Tax=Lachnellula hyalina TaxID=1316788 RepID=A0A8H8QYQ8_9HELO|nr:Peroxide stress-activated histidine kinase [Lachnellula hyalina]TVY25193.1 Peroxide stress-activated histidine kinase [Lachnellula hyalina]